MAVFVMTAINRADDAHGHQPSWEVTLALPYGWWNFREEQMLGIRMIAWSFLPIEEVYVWIAMTFSTVTVYEIMKRWKGSGRSIPHAFLGRTPSHDA